MREQHETVSVGEAATLARVSETTIRRWIHLHFLKATRVAPQRGTWRIDKADLKRRLGLDGGEA